MSDSASNDDSPVKGPPSAKPINPWTVPILMIIIALGAVVGVNYVFKYAVTDKAADQERLPYLSRLDKNLIATADTGEQVELKDLKGKVILTSYLFTRCPTGCAGIQAELASVREEHKDNPNIHFLSISLDPEHDSPEVLKDFRTRHELIGDDWWFLTGDGKDLRAYMTHKFGFLPPTKKKPEEQLFEGDLFTHDMRVALVDHKGHIRGMYAVMHPQMPDVFIEKLHKDVQTLLEEQAADERAGY